MVGFGWRRADEYECLFMEGGGEKGRLVIMAIMVITTEEKKWRRGQAGRVHFPFRASRMTIRELGRQ